MRAKGPTAIVAGSGHLPVELADHLEAMGQDVRILALQGFASRELRRRAHAVCNLLDPQGILTHLETWSPSAVTLVGAVQRPSLPVLFGVYAALRQTGELRDVFARGDDHLLRGAVSWLEERGFTIAGAHELMPDLAVAQGFHGGAPVRPEHHATIATGIQLLDTLSPYDVGQAVVVADHRILAIEGPEGTDRMMHRVGRLRRSWLGRRREGGVLVKAAKRGQDLRIDMPTIGPRTVVKAARAGLAGIAVGAASTLVLEREATVRAAERSGLFLTSVDLPWMRDGS